MILVAVAQITGSPLAQSSNLSFVQSRPFYLLFLTQRESIRCYITFSTYLTCSRHEVTRTCAFALSFSFIPHPSPRVSHLHLPNINPTSSLSYLTHLTLIYYLILNISHNKLPERVTSIMPPPPTNAHAAVDAPDSHWLDFRRKHNTELQEFGRQVREKRSKFEQSVQKAKAELLERHKREEEDFWRGVHGEGGSAHAIKHKTASKGDAKASAKDSAEGRKVAATTKTGDVDKDGVKKTSAPSATEKKSAVTYIDLCSDEEEEDGEPSLVQKSTALTAPAPKPATSGPQSSNIEVPVVARQGTTYSIPSATLKLFGNKPRTFGVCW